jgi:hypothetical protein
LRIGSAGLGALLILAVLGITHGRAVDAGAAMLRRWFGFGRFLVAAAVFAAGWLLLLWRKIKPAGEYFACNRC